MALVRLTSTQLDGMETFGIMMDTSGIKKKARPIWLSIKYVVAVMGTYISVDKLELFLKGRDNNWEIIEQELTTQDFWGLEWFNDRLYIATTTSLYELENNELRLVNFGKIFLHHLVAII